MLVGQIIAFILIALLGWYVFKNYPLKRNVYHLTEISLLLVVALLLSRFSLMVGFFGVPSLKIGISQVPLMLVGMLYGPQFGFLAGVIYDVLGLIVTPTDFPFLGFTLTNILVATLPGFIFSRGPVIQIEKTKRIVVGIIALFCFGLLISMLVMGDSFPIEMSDVGRWIMIILALLYPIIMEFVYRFIRNYSDHFSIDGKIMLSVFVIDAGVNLFLNPIWLTIIYGIPFIPSFLLRLMKLLFVLPVDTILLSILYRTIKHFIGGRR